MLWDFTTKFSGIGRQRQLLASFDRDCDRLSWLTRVATPAEVGGAMPSLPESDLPASPDNV